MDKLLPAEKTTAFGYLSDLSDDEIIGIIKDGYTDFLFDICYNITMESMMRTSPMVEEFKC